MAESVCLGGPGLVGKADASQATEAGRKETLGELSMRRGLSHSPLQPQGSRTGAPALERHWDTWMLLGGILKDAGIQATLQTKLTL